MNQWQARSSNEENKWSEAMKNNLQQEKKELMTSIDQSAKKTNWESPNEHGSSFKNRNDQGNI